MRTPSIITTLALTALFGFAACLTGCDSEAENKAEDVGNSIENAADDVGESIEDTAEDVKDAVQ
ncbi:MAG: hypothetical protein PF961_20855 [Planctomycetota bacterium]|jgi:hypothetical protein|nr:hypothetical protein [Planctomycetota bacterium]